MFSLVDILFEGVHRIQGEVLCVHTFVQVPVH